jgi:hypothetical protein
MSKASELLERVLQNLDGRKLKPWSVWHFKVNQCDFTCVNRKVIKVEETFRYNNVVNGLESVTVTLKVYELDQSILDGHCGSAKTLIKVKVPKDASDRVIDKRIDQIEAVING